MGGDSAPWKGRCDEAPGGPRFIPPTRVGTAGGTEPRGTLAALFAGFERVDLGRGLTRSSWLPRSLLGVGVNDRGATGSLEAAATGGMMPDWSETCERSAKLRLLGAFELDAHSMRHRTGTMEDSTQPEPAADPPRAVSDEDVYKRWFGLADQDQDGRVTGKDAVEFFGLSGLPKEALSRAWQLADLNRQGYLGKDQFVRAIRVIAMVQGGTDVSKVSIEALDAAIDAGSLPVAELEGLAHDSSNKNNPFATKAMAESLKEVAERTGNTYPTKTPGRRNPGSNPRGHRMSAAQATGVVDALKEIYKTKVRPVEEALKFGSFYSPLLTDGDFEGKPNVLLLGQYSTGKTTFIKHLLGTEYPGCNIGPEPTTDRFVVVTHGREPRVTPGQTLAVQTDKPFTGLSNFGSAFLSKFQASSCDAKLLEEVTIIDTPGVLSGEKQRIDRGYSFVHVCEWFAARSDVILLLFDPHKLDISDEFKSVIASLRGHDDKVRVVLNKADQVSAQQLMRVYGALMWSLGKVFNTPEVCKVYVGSFNDKPLNTENNQLGAELFEKEQGDLKRDLLDIPQRSCDRKVNEFVKRVRACVTHAKIMTHLRGKMPLMAGHESKQKKLLGRLDKEFEECVHSHQIPKGDLPNERRFAEICKGIPIWKMQKVDKRQMQALEEVLSVDIPDVMRRFDNPF